MSNVPPPPPSASPPPPPPPPSSPPPPPSYGQPTGLGAPRYAGWWRRVGASIIDGLISLVFVLPGFVAFLVGPKESGLCTDFDGTVRDCNVPTGATVGIAVLLYIVGFIAYLVIYCRMLGRGATWGRQALGYQVLDANSMQPIGTGRAVGRYFATILSAMPCYLGFLWPLWDAEKRTFHDMIVTTRSIMN